MTDQIKQEMENDIALAKNMASVGSAKSILELVNHLIAYLEIVNQAIVEYEYKADQLKGKKEVLKQYVMTGKDMAKTVGIGEYLNK